MNPEMDTIAPEGAVVEIAPHSPERTRAASPQHKRAASPQHSESDIFRGLELSGVNAPMTRVHVARPSKKVKKQPIM